MSRTWDRCEHCRGKTKCDCGDCRVYIGSGYDNYTEGICTVCGGTGGQYKGESNNNYPT